MIIEKYVIKDYNGNYYSDSYDDFKGAIYATTFDTENEAKEKLNQALITSDVNMVMIDKIYKL